MTLPFPVQVLLGVSLAGFTRTLLVTLQAFVLSTAAAQAALGSLPSGTTVAQLFYGIVRNVRNDGLLDVAVVPNSSVAGYTNLQAGAFYKPSSDGSAFERTTQASEARGIALDANNMRLIFPLNT